MLAAGAGAGQCRESGEPQSDSDLDSDLPSSLPSLAYASKPSMHCAACCWRALKYNN